MIFIFKSKPKCGLCKRAAYPFISPRGNAFRICDECYNALWRNWYGKPVSFVRQWVWERVA